MKPAQHTLNLAEYFFEWGKVQIVEKNYYEIFHNTLVVVVDAHANNFLSHNVVFKTFGVISPKLEYVRYNLNKKIRPITDEVWRN